MLRLIESTGNIRAIDVMPEYTKRFLDGRRVGQYMTGELAAILHTEASDVSVCNTVDGRSRLVYSVRAMRQQGATNQVATNLSPFERIAGDVLEVPIDSLWDAMEGGR